MGKEQVDVNKLNMLTKLLTGNNQEDNINDLELIETHGIKLSTKHIVGLTSLRLVNDYFDIPEIDNFLKEYTQLGKFTRESNRDLMKAMEVKNNKKLIEKTSIGLKVSG